MDAKIFVVGGIRYVGASIHTLNVSLCLAIHCIVPKRRDSVFPLFRLIIKAFSSNQSAMAPISLESFDLISLISSISAT